jgi:hypothetical protein
LRLIYERQWLDERNGIKPPATWQECILLYLGIRRDPEVAYDPTSHEPVGEYRCEVFVHPRTREQCVRRMFVPYQSVALAKRRKAEERRSGS